MTHRRLAVASLLLVLLISPIGVFATDHAGERTELAARSPGFWGTLRGAWSHITAIWEKEGSSLDPFGNPKPNSEGEPTNAPSLTQEHPADLK